MNNADKVMKLALGIIEAIGAADARAKAAEHTDTGELWELLKRIRDDAREIKRLCRASSPDAAKRAEQTALDLD